MIYNTVFDVSQSGRATSGLPAAHGLLFVAAGALMVFKPALMQRLLPSGLQGMPRRLFSWYFFLFALIWTTTTFLATTSRDQATRADLATGNFSVVEGRVTHFVPMPYGGHAKESFDVQGHPFSYSDYILTSGFNNTASHGGPMHEGLQVRITYSGNLILRLEIAQ